MTATTAVGTSAGAGAAEGAGSKAGAVSAAQKAGGAVKKSAGGAARKSASHAAAAGTAAKNIIGPGRTSPATAKKVVLFAVVLSGGAVVLYDLKGGKLPNVRLGVGVLFAGVILSGLADVIPEVAAPLALLMVVGVMLSPQPGGSSPGAELIKSVRGIVPRGGVRGA